MKDQQFKFIDLFAGIGGFHAAGTLAGGESVFSNDLDKHSATTFESWFGSKRVTGDIRAQELLRSVPEHDVLFGGFPCQPFSIAGVSSRNYHGIDHGFQDLIQGNLFFSIVEIAIKNQTPLLVLENVRNFFYHDQGRTWRTAREILEQQGYIVRAQLLDAAQFVPQSRKRVFILAFHRDFYQLQAVENYAFPEERNASPRLQSILETGVNPKYELTDGVWSVLQKHAEKHKARGNGFGFSIADRAGVSRTLSARYHKDGAEVLIEDNDFRNPRRLTPTEAMRLMGFNESIAREFGHPEGFPQVVSDTQMYKQLGNAVCPQLVLELLTSLKMQDLLPKQNQVFGEVA
jgi:DNA (cytosine-5)-methyltransferase 1